MNDPLNNELKYKSLLNTTRRHFLGGCATGLGAIWLSAQSGASASAAAASAAAENVSAVRDADRDVDVDAEKALHVAAKVKRVIFLHMIGAPSQLELFDYKPDLKRLDGKRCPQAFLEGKRFAFIQGTPQMMGPRFPFKQHGQSGAWVSDRLPHFSQMVDDACFIKSMQTDQFNHGPAQLMVHTGQSRLGYPSIGSWVTYGMGTENANLPGFVVLLSGGRLPRVGKALWGGGFLPSVYQGVQCRSTGDPVLNISNPGGVTRDKRRAMLDALGKLNEKSYEQFGDPETLTRIAQYELAYRMQAEVPDAMDIKQESKETLEMYGAQPGKKSFANNCLLARRLVEKGVRFVQLYDWGWDTHGSSKSEALNHGFVSKCKQMDRPMAALLADLKQRGMLEDTLVVWSGEFGRTPMRENRGGVEMKFYGRDHNPSAFTLWMAGAGVKPGMTYGATDEVGYNAVENPVQLRDFHATLLRLLGFNHEKFSVPFQGLNQKLTGVKHASVIDDILS